MKNVELYIFIATIAIAVVFIFIIVTSIKILKSQKTDDEYYNKK